MRTDQTKQTAGHKSKILPNLFNEKYGLKLGEFNNTTGTGRVKLTVLLTSTSIMSLASPPPTQLSIVY